MPQDEGLDESFGWDEVVDVICVGTSPGVLAYAICCAAADLDVLLVEPPEIPDPQIDEWYAAMTEDLADLPAECPVPERALDEGDRVRGKREILEPFVGEHLRQWSARCLGSPFAVMFTQVPDVLTPMRSSDGESVTAAVLGRYSPPLGEWLRHRAAEYLPAEERLAAVVFHEGRIAGIELADGSRVGATGGLAFPVGPPTAGWPNRELDADVALVSRAAGRFARVELLPR